MRASNPYRCECGHLHGAFPCEATVETLSCGCRQFRRSVAVSTGLSQGRRVDQGASFAVSALYHLQAYGLQNPWVAWCVEKGAYVDLEEREPCEQDVVGTEGRRVGVQLGIHLHNARQLR